MRERFESVTFWTDTATFCLFDEAALAHRLPEDADWWADPDAEVFEVNRGNMVVVDLGSDGRYTAAVGWEQNTSALAPVRAQVRCVSGRMFLGPGEDIPGGEVGPDTLSGGRFLALSPGAYRVSVHRTGPLSLSVLLETITGEAANGFAESLILPPWEQTG